MRSAAEIRFRLKQEAMNAALRFAPPELAAASVPEAGALGAFPRPESVVAALRGTAYREELRAVAERILAHRIPALGLEIQTGPDIRWRRDYTSGIETPPLYFRRIPYLDPARAGDHKAIWEINRHQHLVALAQEYRFSGEARFLDEIVRQLESWWRENPLHRGVNWTSALEVAFRALSWIWVWHLVSGEMAPDVRNRLAAGLFHHGLHLEHNLSVYFSPNTHLLGEAVALHAIGKLFPSLPRSDRWRRTGAAWVENEMRRQVRADGSHFEQSAYYHLYAVDMFAFHALVARPGAAYPARLGKMADYLEALAGPGGSLPLIGDDDGGRFFHPYSRREVYALETLAVCGRVRAPEHAHAIAAWWGPVECPGPSAGDAAGTGSGLLSFVDGRRHVLFDCGPFGPGSGGHSHADTLSLVARSGSEQILIDPGTYTYAGSREWRERFRGTSMHNTVRIDGLDQAEPATAFSWRSKPEAAVLERTAEGAAGECRYAGFTHRRRIVFDAGGLTITDEVEGPEGEHRIEQFWHAGEPVERVSENCFRIGTKAVLQLGEGAACRVEEGGEVGWISPALGVKRAAPAIVAEWNMPLPARFAARLDLER